MNNISQVFTLLKEEDKYYIKGFNGRYMKREEIERMVEKLEEVIEQHESCLSLVNSGEFYSATKRNILRHTDELSEFGFTITTAFKKDHEFDLLNLGLSIGSSIEQEGTNPLNVRTSIIIKDIMLEDVKAYIEYIKEFLQDNEN